MKKLEKSHDTGLRIIEVLKVLLEDDLSKQSIIEKLKMNDDFSSALTFEAYLKYFNTLSLFGIKINKKNDVYFLENAILSISLTDMEEQVLHKLIKSIPKLNSLSREEKIKHFFTKLDKYVNSDLKSKLKEINSYNTLSTKTMEILNTLKNFLEKSSKVNIIYERRNGKKETLECELKKISEEKGYYYVLCYNNSMQRCKRIYISSIVQVRETSKQIQNLKSENTVIYEVYGRLSKSYKIKEWESLIEFGSDYARIANTEEDFETLLPRLLKYGENCKILKPNNIVDDFLLMTEEVLRNLNSTMSFSEVQKVEIS